jgi:4,5-dihydroxyphthalate decarboxylase
MTVSINFACGAYDRTFPLFTGEVKPEGIDLTYTFEESPRDLFDALAGGPAYEAAELSLSEYICGFAAGDSPFVAIPAFPSRVFRHGFIFVNKRSGITEPKDLQGKRIGTPLYTATAMVYMRALLQHDYGVDLSSLRWIQGELRGPSQHELPTTLLKPVSIELNKDQKGLVKLLEEGQIDALLSPSVPASIGAHPDVARLFPNYREVELEYFRRTQIFPIMHLVAIRRDVYERNPFVAASMYKALCQAKDIAQAKLLRKGASMSMLPWARPEAESMQELFGQDFWPYGVEANRPTLQAMVSYLAEQGMIARRPTIEELFVDVTSAG